jgi:hypothetical protein
VSSGAGVVVGANTTVADVSEAVVAVSTGVSPTILNPF